MEVKWRMIIFTPTLLGLVQPVQPMPADYLADKVFAQMSMLLTALALTLGCLPSLRHKPRNEAESARQP
jgi:hypothetical protein